METIFLWVKRVLPQPNSITIRIRVTVRWSVMLRGATYPRRPHSI